MSLHISQSLFFRAVSDAPTKSKGYHLMRRKFQKAKFVPQENFAECRQVSMFPYSQQIILLEDLAYFEVLRP